MTQRARILIAVGILVVLIAAVLAIEVLRRQSASEPAAGAEVTLAPGSIPIHVDGQLVSGFSPEDLEQMEQVSFVDDEKGKKQEGWLLSDVLTLHVDENALGNDTLIVVSSSSREKSVQLTWAEVEEPANMVMFDLSGRGTLKLVSKLEGLDTRDDWVQDVDKIEVINQ
jgi:methionine-rich copper-binding protein CopC